MDTAWEDARIKFEQGIEHFRRESYAQALDAFEASYAARRSPIALYNIGMCQKALSQYTASLNTFHMLMTLEPLDEDLRAGVVSAIAQMAPLFGYIRLEDAPDGATVVVNGEPVGTTPLPGRLPIEPGHHTIVVSKPGYESLELTITVNQEEVYKVRAALPKRHALLKVDCPLGAILYLNGARAGLCPFEGTVAPGEIEVAVTALGKKDKSEKINLTEGETMGLAVRLEAAPSASTSIHHDQQSVVLEETDKESSIFLISGIVSTALGVFGIGVGIVYSVRWKTHRDDVAEIIQDANRANGAQEKNAYDRYRAQYDAAIADLKEDVHPRDRAGIISGFVLGGVLTAAGATLLVLHTKISKKERRTAVSPLLGGIAVDF